ncbi:Glucose dehydrogenase [FAD, quinone] [Orchesella cincta]|uniref:Glucose dehydrogenase [FAD, quinone] n=1 Tax=Orchesella cincta TaxID=48709 RepID=A0A1D2N3R4_ORCCI|nr:Glucose dehydrogenase [FAD, quinone] [Orchesella cincta]
MAPPNSRLVSLPSLSNIFRLILDFPNPFPSINSLVITNIPVAVLVYATYSYYMDFMASRMADLANNGAEDVFDFIIIGGGSAGAVVANRLSLHYKTLLIEAGGDPHPLSAFPTTSLVTLNLPLIDWGFKTVPQQHACYALKGNISQWPRGMALGGSSVQNIMMFMRGNPKDFADWSKVIGSDEWTYEKLLPYFKKLEDYNGYGNNSPYHGKNGPLHVEKLRFAPGLETWLEAGKELGYDIIDPNGFQRVGLQFGKGLALHGLMKFARATKEIILSAGAVMTPTLLMHSGIGRRDHLVQVGIKPRLDLPVGKNLQDHIFAVIGPFLLNQTVSYILDRDTTLGTVVDYFRNGTGPIVSISGIGGAGFFASSLSKDNYPDIYLNHVGVGVHETFGKDLDYVFSFKENTMERYYAPYVGKDAYFFVVNLGKVRSIGEIKLKSRDEFEYPYINPRYLSHPHDVQNMIEAIKIGVNIYENTTAFGKLGAKLVSTKLPGCEKHEFRSDAYWECYVRHFTLTVYHPCCTARAGAVNDPNAVVDPELRVIGTKNLRVIDASVMPKITNANLNAPTIMIGEKGSDLVLKYWSRALQHG